MEGGVHLRHQFLERMLLVDECAAEIAAETGWIATGMPQLVPGLRIDVRSGDIDALDARY
jgi:hypothetical protein